MLDYQLINELQDLEIVSKITIFKESTEIYFNKCHHNQSKLNFTVVVTLENGHNFELRSNKQIEKFLTKLYEEGAY